MKRVPLAKLAIKNFSNTALLAYAIKINTALDTAPGSTNFVIPAAMIQPGAATIPPVTPTFGNQIETYRDTLGAAYKGTKLQTAAKDEAKQAVIETLQQYWNFVNQTMRGFTEGFPSYPDARALVLTSGFEVNDFSEARQELEAPVIRSITGVGIGSIKIILNKFSKSGKQRTKKVPGVKVWEINYRTSAVGVLPAGPWQTEVSSSYFTTITGLVSGISYDIQVRAIGRDSSTSVPTLIRSIVVL